jgi:hypothetical protein
MARSLRLARSLRESFGKLDQETTVGRILDSVEGDDEPQTFNHVQIEVILAEQAQQFLSGRFAIVCAHA